MANIYELAVLYRDDPKEDLDKAIAEVKQLIKDQSGKIIKEDVWGKRQLAYLVKKQSHAFYVFYDLEIPSESLAKIETTLNISEGVLRYQFYKPDLKALAAALANPAPKAEPEAAPAKKSAKKEKVKDVA